MNWFGTKKKPEPSTTTASSQRATSSVDPNSTIVKLRENLLSQEKREVHLDRKIDQATKDAKEKLVKKDKRGAMFLLKKKKLYESEIDKIGNVKITLETQIMNLESAAQNAQTFQAMNAGRYAMEKIRTDVGIEKVDDMMDDIREEMEMANEISNAIAQPVDPLMTDEDDLLKELEELEAEDVEADLLKIPNQKEEITMPDAPSSELPELEKDEEADLRKLEAELSGM